MVGLMAEHLRVSTASKPSGTERSPHLNQTPRLLPIIPFMPSLELTKSVGVHAEERRATTLREVQDVVRSKIATKKRIGAKREIRRLQSVARKLAALADPLNSQRLLAVLKASTGYFHNAEPLHLLAAEDLGAQMTVKRIGMDFAERLSSRAFAGHSDAASLMVELATYFTTRVNELARANPSLVAGQASVQMGWPKIVSHNRAFKGDEVDFEAIGLGKNFPIPHSKKARSKASKMAGRIAFELLNHVQRLRHRARLLARSEQRICDDCWCRLSVPASTSSTRHYCGRCKLPLLANEHSNSNLPRPLCPRCASVASPSSGSADIVIEDSSCLVCRRCRCGSEFPAEKLKGLKLIQRAAILPEFRRDTANEWWVVGRECLLSGFPSENDADCLDEKAPLFAKLITAPSHLRSPKEHRTRIFGVISQHFGYLVTGAGA